MTTTFHATPVPTSATTKMIVNGHGGNKDLPVSELQGGNATQWVLPKAALKAWLRSPHCINLVVLEDGSMSMTVIPAQTVKDT